MSVGHTDPFKNLSLRYSRNNSRIGIAEALKRTPYKAMAVDQYLLNIYMSAAGMLPTEYLRLVESLRFFNINQAAEKT